jgi:hypothetical protein
MSQSRFNGVLSTEQRNGRSGPLMLVAAAALLWAGNASAVGSMVDVAVIERDTGNALQVYRYKGSQYVAGRPGTPYAIRISNHSGARVLAVMAVDGVNIISGQTASWNQSGYVLEPWQAYEITGWRKSQQEVAAFEFTTLPESYAARTGRPNDVGVIGVAVFAERPIAPAPSQELSREDSRGRLEGASRASSEKAAPVAAPAANQDSAQSSARRSAPEPAQKLGTGHGAREDSYATRTTFVRSSSQPLEVVSIQYDRFQNLVRAGIIGERNVAHPRPFPRSGEPGFVPDPPNW